MQPVGFGCHVEITKAEEAEGNWIVEGFAATSDFDLQGDVITQEAIAASAKDLIENSTVLLNHDTDEAIGKVVASEAREKGLYLKVLVSKTVPEVWQKIKEGVLSKFSIRGRILEARKQWLAKLQKFARMIFKMQLLEVSLVAVPANPKARAMSWYVEKALSDFEAAGGRIEQDGTGGKPMTNGEKAKEDETEIILEATGDPAEPKTEKPEAAGKPADGVLEKRLTDLTVSVERIAGVLGLAKNDVPAKDAKGPSLVEKVDALAKRLEALESAPGQRTSLEGQEGLPGEDKGKRGVWKGLV